MEHFRVPRIKDFLCHQPWQGQGLGSLDNLCIPEPGHNLMLLKLKSCIGLWKSKLLESRENY